MSGLIPEGLRFLGVPEEYAQADRARFVLLPVPYEATTTWRKGTRMGPDAIIRASYHLERLDEENWSETWKEGIATLPSLDVSGSPPDVFSRAAQTLEPHLRRGQFVITIGGEHSLTEGPLSAVAGIHRGVSVLHVDAHADLRDTYRGSEYNHACAARRMMQYAGIVQVGVRSVSEDESFRCRRAT